MSEGVDYTQEQQVVDGNTFERGSRHPLWRGGTSSDTRKRRQKTYHKFGIGILTSSNSAAARSVAALKKNPVADFIAERSKRLVINDIKNTDQANTIIKRVFGSQVNDPFFETLNTDIKLIYVNRVQFSIKIEDIESIYKLNISRTGVVKRAKQKVNKNNRPKQRSSQLKRTQNTKSNTIVHKNKIKGFGDII